VIGLLFSDWSDGPVLWLVYSALIGQMAQSVVIGLLCSDWSDGPVCCDWSTLLWLVRRPSLLWFVNSVLVGQIHIWILALDLPQHLIHIDRTVMMVSLFAGSQWRP